MAKRDYRHYQKVFNSFVKNGIPVTGTKYDTNVSEVVTDASLYRQCYKKGNKAREQLPRYWFISKEGFLINARGDVPTWTSPNLKTERPMFIVSNNGKRYALTSYDLVALVWDGYVSDDAQKLLDQYGLKAFGSHNKQKTKRKKKQRKESQHTPKVQGHHKKNCYIAEKSMQSYIANNRPDHIQIITNREHIILHSLTGDFETDAKKFYRSNMVNVLDDSVKIYSPSDGAMLDPKNLIIKEVTGYSIDLRESDSYRYDGYLFYLENGRGFLEQNKDLLLGIAKQNPTFTEFTCDGQTIRYWKEK